MKSHGFEFGSTPPETIGTFLPLKGCNAVEVNHGVLMPHGMGIMSGDHELRVNNPNGKDALAFLLVFSQPITPTEAVLKRSGTLVKFRNSPQYGNMIMSSTYL